MCGGGAGSGLVVACDLLPLDPVPGAVTLPGRDFTAPDTWREIREALGGRKVSCDWRRAVTCSPLIGWCRWAWC